MKRLIGLLVIGVLVVAASSCAGTGGRLVFAEFADVGDLVSRANVQQSDAVVGSIRSIELVNRGGRWYARVAMQVGSQTKVNQGTRAVVRSTSLLGEKYVDLISTTNAPSLAPDGVIPASQTAKAPELEQVFSQLGAILQSGALEDLAKITTASAMILEGQQGDVGRVLDGTAKLIASIRAQKDALAQGLGDLNSAAGTLAAGKGTLDRALTVSDGALRIVADQAGTLNDLVIQLDRLGAPLANLTRNHRADIDAQVKSLNAIVPKLYEVRSTLDAAVKKLPGFTKLFARATPGDYVQLDIFLQSLPFGTPTAATAGFKAMLLEAAK